MLIERVATYKTPLHTIAVCCYKVRYTLDLLIPPRYCDNQRVCASQVGSTKGSVTVEPVAAPNRSQHVFVPSAAGAALPGLVKTSLPRHHREPSPIHTYTCII